MSEKNNRQDRRKMADKKFWLGMFVLVLTFGMSVICCDNGNSTSMELDSALFGTWIHAEDGDEFTFNQDGTFSWEYDGDYENGTWSTSGDKLTLVLWKRNIYSPLYL
jgi:hypothetical protein